MAITSAISSGPYTGTGSQTGFPFFFSALVASDVVVRVSGAIISSALYSVSVSGDGNSGTVVFASAPASGVEVFIEQSPDFIQDGQFLNEAAYNLSSVNATNRRQTMRANWLHSVAVAALPDGWQDTGNRAGKYLAWDDAGDPYFASDGFASGAEASALDAEASAVAANASSVTALSAQVAAEAALDAILTAYDQFDDRYLGSKAANPTLDNDGAALVGGALYYNSAVGEMRIWTGAAWVAAYVSGTGFVSKTGDTMTGPLVTVASGTGAAGFNAPHGTAPTSPANGDVWTTTAGIYARINGTTRKLASLDATETLTGKTFDLTDNTLNGTLAEFNAACSDADLAADKPTVSTVSTSFSSLDAHNNTHRVASGTSQTLTLNSTPAAGVSFSVRFTTAWSISCAGGLSKNGADPSAVTSGSVAAHSLVSFFHEGAGVWIATGNGVT